MHPDIPQLVERVQQTAGGGAVETDGDRHFAQRHAFRLFAERDDDVQPARQGTDKGTLRIVHGFGRLGHTIQYQRRICATVAQMCI